MFPKALDENNISVIAVGGKDNIDKMVKLVLRGPPRKSIMNLGREFFEQDCAFGCDGRKIYAEIEKMRSRLQRNNESLFNEAKTFDVFDDDEIPLILEKLRSNGVCVLNGEMENCSKDTDFLAPTKKLCLEKIYELNERLSNGTEITDLFDVSEIKEFLRVVIER